MNELDRLHALDSYLQMQSFPQKEIDEITELASIICETPISLLTFVESDRQSFQSKVGIEGDGTPRAHAFCHYTIQSPTQLMEVPDSLADERFKDNPLATGEMNVRFYAGAPLVTEEGFALGSLCVIDHEPRTLTASQKRSLTLLSNRAVKLLDEYKAKMEVARLFKSSNERLFTLANQAPFIIATLNPALQITYINHPFGGAERDEILQQQPFQWIHPDYLDCFIEKCQKVQEEGKRTYVELKLAKLIDKTEWVSCRIAPIREENGPAIDLMVICIDITERIYAEESKKQKIASLQKMLYMVSHELRSPVTKIQGLVQLMKDEKTPEEDKQKCLEFLYHSAIEIDQFTRDLTQFIYQGYSNS